ncbi:MAG: GNAT family N-acetyltransferase [Gemmatimonadales bacterium]|nr:GNAT family N-acetyltransferase [Gemmatimonadales bacterium]MDQ3427985.1 GNAT family N-acetyltransferase [Gemmatimonadota bacterium]
MAAVVSYRKAYDGHFERLNREWIEAHFVVEDADREVFRDPEGAIIARGGQIFFVEENGKVQGTCAVVRHDLEVYEIAKMGVAEAARGKGFGDLLMEAALGFAREVGARRVFIVSNTRLAPAIRLYQKHGFTRVPLGGEHRYARADIQLELTL